MKGDDHKGGDVFITKERELGGRDGTISNSTDLAGGYVGEEYPDNEWSMKKKNCIDCLTR